MPALPFTKTITDSKATNRQPPPQNDKMTADYP